MGHQLSPNKLSLFFDCKKCFWLRINENVKRPSGPFPSLPNGMDKIIKQYFQEMREKDEKPKELKEASFDVDAEPIEDEKLLEKAREWRNQPKWEDPETGATLCGAVDDLLRSREDGKLIVLDYKTKGYPPRLEEGVPDYYERQVNYYNLILRENGYKTKDYGFILYFYPDRIREDGSVIFNKDLRKTDVDIDLAKKQVRNAVQVLDNDIPDHDEDCDYIDWKPKDA